MSTLLRRRFLLGTAGLLAGCGLVPDVNQPLTLYTLKPKLAAQNLPKVGWQLVVAEPAAERDIDTTRIALTRKPNVIEYFADGNWTDTAPNLVQAKLIEAFEGTNAILAVGRDAAGLKPDYILQSDLRDFQAEYQGGAAPTAHVRLMSKLVQMPDRRIVRSVAAEAAAPAAGKDLPAIVAAFEQALGQVLDKTVAAILSPSS
ncbi:MAG TPA: ABC-type transport auxiliary lipoprotein family protein [Dongiaceae bacterium]|jgi:cholesterol transport system auxiliary component|nr:ABC-type transport auxiliary lipoprotein family protein [Dongiaceae bacterium]